MASRTDRRVGGRYELVRRIARGGGGTVWAAYDHLLERDVAVKHVAIPDDLPASERETVRARVRSEARAAARLLHPSAVTIFDVLAEDGDVHLVLELVEDPTLDELVRRDGPLPEDEVAGIGIRMLDVLMAAHDRGIVHRDVKPSNIFVSSEGEVKLTDFGIASMDGEARLTQTGATMGSPQFIAPEQALGHDAAPAADLWGLGASLYLAVEGVPPFERGNAIATVHAVVHEEARPTERAERLAPVLAALLQKRPEDRPSEAALREDLSRIAGIDTPPVEAVDTTLIPVRSTPDAAPAPAPSPVPEAAPAPSPAPEAETAPEADTAPEAEEPAAEGPEDTALSASVPVTPPVSPDGAGGADAAAPDAGADDGGAGDDRRWLPAAVVLALVAIVGLVLLTRGGDDPGGDPAGDDPEVAAPEDEADDQTSTDEANDADADDADASADGATDDDGTDAATGAEDGTVPEADVPDDWQTVDGPAYQVAVPADWQVEPGQGRLVDHSDPNSSTYLRVDWTPDPRPDPYQNWVEYDQELAGSFENYERIQLTELTFRGQPAALLEYTYTAGGVDLRAYNLNLLAGDRAYALNLQSQAQDWNEVEPMFPAIVGGFRPDA